MISSNEKTKTVLSWSGGKDSAMALAELREDSRCEVVGLLTTVAEEFDRVSHHGVRAELLVEQAGAVGLPLTIIPLPTSANHPCTNTVYESIMDEALAKFRAEGVFTVAFGDLFLEDLRAYRERNLARVGMRGLFPLWRRDTAKLIRAFIDSGYRAYLSCVEPKLGEAFAGRAIDDALVADLPAGVDPCGEYGEYHSFVYDGPIFHRPVDVRVGEIVKCDGRHYADLLPGDRRDAMRARAADMPPIQ